jgi:hypothetical protein
MTMKSPESLLLKLGRLVLPAAAAAVVLATGPVAIAAPTVTTATPATAKFTWHSLNLINGWLSVSTPTVPTGTPAWAIHNGVVYFRGAIENPNTSSATQFAQLPANARPASNLFLQVYTQGLEVLTHSATSQSAGTPGTVRVSSKGHLFAQGVAANNLTSLDAISYPLASVKPVKLKLKNGWRTDQGTFGTGDPSYAIHGGIVYVSGSLTGGKLASPAAVLPKAARPAHVIWMSVYAFAGATGAVEILPNGQIQVYATAAEEYTSLAGISFPVASTKWHNFKLINGWAPTQSIFGTGAPAYAVINGVVYLTGSTHQVTGFDTELAIIPAAARPDNQLQIGTYTAGFNSGVVFLFENTASTSSTPPGNAQAFTSFGGIAYPLSS